jgi:hypothetical protein
MSGGCSATHVIHDQIRIGVRIRIGGGIGASVAICSFLFALPYKEYVLDTPFETFAAGAGGSGDKALGTRLEESRQEKLSFSPENKQAPFLLVKRNVT